MKRADLESGKRKNPRKMKRIGEIGAFRIKVVNEDESLNLKDRNNSPIIKIRENGIGKSAVCIILKIIRYRYFYIVNLYNNIQTLSEIGYNTMLEDLLYLMIFSITT